MEILSKCFFFIIIIIIIKILKKAFQANSLITTAQHVYSYVSLLLFMYDFGSFGVFFLIECAHWDKKRVFLMVSRSKLTLFFKCPKYRDKYEIRSLRLEMCQLALTRNSPKRWLDQIAIVRFWLKSGIPYRDCARVFSKNVECGGLQCWHSIPGNSVIYVKLPNYQVLFR